MNESNDIKQKRALLLTVRLRFSPQIQPAKQTAIDSIVEQILSLADEGRAMNSAEIQAAFASESGGYTLNPADVRDSLSRLVNQGKAEDLDRKRSYKLSEHAFVEMDEVQREASRRLGSVVDRLFKNAKQEPSSYVGPFLDCISRVFSQLGEEYVRVIKGEISREHFLAFPAVSVTMRETAKEYDFIEYPLFQNAITAFFEEADPEYDLIKWNIGQNYFLIKAVGLDPDFLLLSRDTFGDATLYIDTNLLIPALGTREEYYRDFVAMTKACQQLDIRLKVLQITVEELQTWAETQRGLIEKVVDEIPKGMEHKVRSFFYQAYRESQSSGEPFDIDEIFADFDAPRKHLQESFQVEFEDDPWLTEARDKPEILTFSESLKGRYLEIRKRPKGDGAAIHDALALSWVQKLREEHNGRAWFITADASLPGALPTPSGANSGSLAITQDAFLQWVSPICVEEKDEKDFAALFADMIRRRLLPQERIFDLQDFLVFHELDMSCKELPVEDVESCIRHVRRNAPMLNPLNPVDREKLASQVSKFFASPGRKYRMEITRLEAERQRIEQEFEGTLRQRDRRIEELEERSLTRSAQFRMGLTIFVFVTLETIAGFLAGYYGVGANLWQRILNWWQLFFGLIPAVTILISWFLIGRERLSALGWAFAKIFKHE